MINDWNFEEILGSAAGPALSMIGAPPVTSSGAAAGAAPFVDVSAITQGLFGVSAGDLANRALLLQKLRTISVPARAANVTDNVTTSGATTPASVASSRLVGPAQELLTFAQTLQAQVATLSGAQALADPDCAGCCSTIIPMIQKTVADLVRQFGVVKPFSLAVDLALESLCGYKPGEPLSARSAGGYLGELRKCLGIGGACAPETYAQEQLVTNVSTVTSLASVLVSAWNKARNGQGSDFFAVNVQDFVRYTQAIAAVLKRILTVVPAVRLQTTSVGQPAVSAAEFFAWMYRYCSEDVYNELRSSGKCAMPAVAATLKTFLQLTEGAFSSPRTADDAPGTSHCERLCIFASEEQKELLEELLCLLKDADSVAFDIAQGRRCTIERMEAVGTGDEQAARGKAITVRLYGYVPPHTEVSLVCGNYVVTAVVQNDAEGPVAVFPLAKGAPAGDYQLRYKSGRTTQTIGNVHVR
jgi:hypothetical protein